MVLTNMRWCVNELQAMAQLRYFIFIFLLFQVWSLSNLHFMFTINQQHQIALCIKCIFTSLCIDMPETLQSQIIGTISVNTNSSLSKT